MESREEYKERLRIAIDTVLSETTRDCGRPLKFKDPEKLKREIEKYLSDCDEKEELPTVTGLAIALNTSRKVLCDYESGKYDNKETSFSIPIKRAKSKIQERWSKFYQDLELQKANNNKPTRDTGKNYLFP